MIIGEKFAWGHLSKTAGHATLAFFDVFPHLIVFADPSRSPATHTFFKEREDEIRGKALCLNIRRLPTWFLDLAQFQSHHGRDPDYVPLPMMSPHEMAESSFADANLLSFTHEGRFEIDTWLRLDSLEEDFLKFISRFTDVTEEQRQKVLAIGEVDAIEYDHEIGHWFTRRHLERMYENNPAWSAVERQAYGDLLID